MGWACGIVLGARSGPGEHAADAAGPTVEAQVVALYIRGSQPWERLDIPDLDVLAVDGRRLLPLRRLAAALKAVIHEDEQMIRVRFDRGHEATLWIVDAEMEVGALRQPVEMIHRFSDITRRRELYLPEPVMARLMGLDLSWSEADYAYFVQTEARLSIWPVPERPELLGIGVQDVPIDLPEMFGPASPRKFSLDYIELRLDSELRLIDETVNTPQLDLQSMQQTFWGALYGGTYKLSLQEPAIEFSSERIGSTEPEPVLLDWFDWTIHDEQAELSIGDSVLGLNDLVFPFMRITGVRFNGIVGAPGGETPGLGRHFLRAQTFDGVAPVGSRVELLVNDVVFDAEDVISIDPAAPPGYGFWRFENIHFAPGSANEVRIRVTDPTGNVTQVVRQVMGTSLLLPEGAMAFIGAAGSNRDPSEYGWRGVFAGGRMAYGVSETLTLGFSAGVQSSFHDPVRYATGDIDQRDYPERSLHLGAEMIWQLSESLLMMNDIAVSHATWADAGSVTDCAFYTTLEWVPGRKWRMRGQYFQFGPEFFNGQSIQPADRAGLVVSGQWRPSEVLEFIAAGGRVWDNLDGRHDARLVVDYYHAAALVEIGPAATLGYSLNVLQPSDGPDARLHGVRLSASPWPEWSINAAWSSGDTIAVADRPDFFTGLNIPGVELFDGERILATVRRRFEPGHTIGVMYSEGASRQRLALLHDLRTLSKPYLQFHTELGQDLDTQTLYFQQRSEYLFNAAGTHRLGVRAELEEEEWMVGLFFTIQDVIAVDDGRLASLSDRAVGMSPDISGGLCGSVFVDANANGVPEVDEPGVPDVRIVAASFEDVTDEKGRFMIPGLTRHSEVRVYLDLATVPAIYQPTHAVQTARIWPRTQTQVNLAVTPCHVVSGRVVYVDTAGAARGMNRVVVTLRPQRGGAIVAESITASDGSYVLENLRPGDYVLEIDTTSVPNSMRLDRSVAVISIPPAVDVHAVKLPAFEATDVAARSPDP